MKANLVSAAIGVVAFGSAVGGEDIGTTLEQTLRAQSVELFGFVQPLGATAADIVPRNETEASDRQLLAKGLQAEYVSRGPAYPTVATVT